MEMFIHMTLNFDIQKKTPKKTLANALFSCDTHWSTSSLGMTVYVISLCINYWFGYYIHTSLYGHQKLSKVRILGDIITTGWIAISFCALPWHQWENLICIKSQNKLKGFGRYCAWMLSTNISMLIYGWMGTMSVFQTSLKNKNMTNDQKLMYIITFIVIACIFIYWILKLFVETPITKKCCRPTLRRKVVFIRLALILAAIFVLSAIVCSTDSNCEYHLHHWWFGVVLITLSTTTLDNWFDYCLQGVFWTLVLESICNWPFLLGEFFV